MLKYIVQYRAVLMYYNMACCKTSLGIFMHTALGDILRVNNQISAVGAMGATLPGKADIFLWQGQKLV